MKWLLHRIVFVLTLGLIKLWDDEEDTPIVIDPDTDAELPRRPPSLPDVPERFENGKEHLECMLRYVDLLVRAQTCRWYVTIAAHKPAEAWGMMTLSFDEVRAYMTSRFALPGRLPAIVRKNIESYVTLAHDYRATIQKAVDVTSADHPDVALPLADLEARFGLEREAVDALMICALPALDGRYRRLFAVLQDDGTKTRPTAELVLQMLEVAYEQAGRRDAGDATDDHCRLAAARAALDPDAPLWRERILHCDRRADDRPLLLEPIAVDERIVRYLLGVNGGDERVKDILSTPYDADPWNDLDLILSETRIGDLRALRDRIRDMPAVEPAAVFFYGPYGSGRTKAARAVLNVRGRGMFQADTRRALEDREHWRLLVDLCYREAKLAGKPILWTDTDALDEPDVSVALKEHLLEIANAQPLHSLFTGETPFNPRETFRNRAFARFGIPKPPVDIRQRLWEYRLESEEMGDQNAIPSIAKTLANAFQLTHGQVLDAIAAARAHALRSHPNKRGLRLSDLEAGCRRQAGQRLHALATLSAPDERLDFKQLILPADPLKQLKHLEDRIKNRSEVFKEYEFGERHRLGQGLVALFTGTSGTGKTLAATVIASRVGQDLYRVDMAKIVSMYVGETEKNLARVFDEATGSNAILFFDEAENLFGKRSEVKDAKDRWANQEVAYLLQRIEEYAGAVIMATNLQQNIDHAFLRRIQAVIEFPFPARESRLKLWKLLLIEDESALTTSQYEYFAERFMLAGGDIRNVVVDAAFRTHKYVNEYPLRAAELGYAIRFKHVLFAVAREYLKLGRPLTRSTFGRDHYDRVMREFYPEVLEAADSAYV